MRDRKVESPDSDTLIQYTQFIRTDSFLNLRPWRGENAINRIYRKRHDIFARQNGSGMRKALNYDMYTYMQDILMRTDKMSMASSIEVRVPYLMPELLEFVSSIPDSQLVGHKLTGSMKNTKMILKSLSEDVYGSDFTYRGKMGLGFPFLKLFTSPDVEQYINEKLMPQIEKRGLVNYDYVKSIWNQRRQWTVDKGYERQLLMVLWVVCSFEIWAEMYLDGNPLQTCH